jgi:hypothetical protein
MDWTTNPLVALYFAARQTQLDDSDKPLNSAVYVLTSEPVRFSELGRPTEDTIKPVGDSATMTATTPSAYEDFGVEVELAEETAASDASKIVLDAPPTEMAKQPATEFPVVSPFSISENVHLRPAARFPAHPRARWRVVGVPPADASGGREGLPRNRDQA